MEDQTCPNCAGPARLLPKVGDRKDYECPRCGPVSVAGSHEPAINRGDRAILVHGTDGRTWLKPVAAAEDRSRGVAYRDPNVPVHGRKVSTETGQRTGRARRHVRRARSWRDTATAPSWRPRSRWPEPIHVNRFWNTVRREGRAPQFGSRTHIVMAHVAADKLAHALLNPDEAFFVMETLNDRLAAAEGEAIVRQQPVAAAYYRLVYLAGDEDAASPNTR
jgi:hypothetical protein